MPDKYESGGSKYNITVYPGPDNTKTYPVIVLLHGNGSFRAPFGEQIHGFAESLAKLGYVAAVPGYYIDDNPPPVPPLANMDRDPGPHVQKLADAIAEVGKRKDADVGRLGLIGYSLGAAVAMRYIVGNPKKVQVLADFFGPVDATIKAGVGNFPPTMIFHNEGDEMVPITNSEGLDEDLEANKIKHHFQPYSETGTIANHPFEPDGFADKDSRERLTKWFVIHLPPAGM
jgi:carboxymethylenebutenolidase